MNACSLWIDTGKKLYKWVHINNYIKVQYLYNTCKAFQFVIIVEMAKLENSKLINLALKKYYLGHA